MSHVAQGSQALLGKQRDEEVMTLVSEPAATWEASSLLAIDPRASSMVSLMPLRRLHEQVQGSIPVGNTDGRYGGLQQPYTTFSRSVKWRTN